MEKDMNPNCSEAEKSGDVNWLNLPDHLISLISEKLIRIKDYIRFGAVCLSWQSVYTTNKCRLPPQIPVLMLPREDDGDDEIRCFYDIGEKRVYDFPLRVPHNQYCRGSSQGWLVTVYQNSVVRLLNPFLSLNNEIELPPLTTFELVPDDEINNEAYLQKAVLSANPLLNPNYVVMAVHGGHSRLAFCKPGDQVWNSIIDSDCRLIDDVVYWKDKFYVVDHFGVAWVCDVESHPHPRVSRLSSPIENDGGGRGLYDIKNYIVESSGDLLQVRRSLGWLEYDEDLPKYYTAQFQVFKLDLGEKKWVQLNSLGGQMLFVGDNYSVSLLAADYPGCKPNCIYFTDDYHAGYTEEGDGPRDMGVYNLEDGRIEPHYPMKSATIFPAPIWIEPTLNMPPRAQSDC